MRRRLLIALALLSVAPARADLPKVQSLGEARRWLDRIDRASRASTSGAWPLGMVLEHLAQSIEMSMDGYPLPRAPWFQGTVGVAAFGLFKWRGRMSHGLAEPIPGAPALVPTTDWRPAALRLRRAIERFDAHRGALAPHFAYGRLDKADYAIAHTLHIANHQDEIVLP